jgi:hypothetical protein
VDDGVDGVVNDAVNNGERIYLAATVREAKAVEEWLTAAGIDYAVEVEPCGRSFLFGSVRMGAAFYVDPSHASYCREHLAASGLRRVVEDVPPEDG